MKQIGKSLKKHRMAKGMTQDQLAEQLSVTRQAISNWETGKTQPGIETITALAAVFGITVEELINSSPRRPVFTVDGNTSPGVIFGGLFLMIMMVFLLGGAALFTNGWWLMIAVAATASGLVTALIRQSDRIQALAARIEELEKKLES